MPSSPRDAAPAVGGADLPLVGRDLELGLLRGAYSQAVERGTSHVVNLIGEAGVGKSRLLDELSDWIRRRPDRAVVLRGRAAAEGRAMPRSGLRSLVAQRFQIRDDDVSEAVAAKLRSGLGPLTAGQAAIVGHWLGFDLGESRAVRDLAGNPEFGTIALGHLTAHFQALLARAPLVLLLEDLQWSDPESLDLVGHVVDAFPDEPVLVVCETRPSLFDRRPRWSAGPGDATTTIELAPLTTADCREHVRGLLHRADGLTTQLVERVADHAQGNPLLAEELVALLAHEGAILTDRQPWTIDHERLDRFALPVDLAAVTRARLAALPPADATLLRHASIIGPTFWDDALVATASSAGVGPRTHAEVASSLRGLGSGLGLETGPAAFVRPHEWSLFTGCREYVFGHPALRAAASDDVAAGDRVTLHRVAARWLERRSGDRLGEQVGLLAEHLTAAGELDRAADLLHEAGARAGATAALRSAIAFYRRSLACREATGTDHGVAATSTRIELGHLLASVGENDEALATYRTAESDATRSSSHRLAANAMAGALRTAAGRGDWEESERLVERVRPLAERFGGEVLGRFLTGRALLLIDGPHQDLETAQRLTEQALEIWRRLEDPSSELRALNQLGFMSSKTGRPADADRWYAEALELARHVGDTSGEWMLLQNQAVHAHREARAGRADYGRVLELYRSSLDQRRRLGLPYVLSLANLAQAEVEAGNIEEGRRNAEEALRIGWSRHDPLDWTIALITLAQVAIVNGRLSEGLTMLGALLAERRTPSLEREIDAVLAVHGLDRSAALARMSAPLDTDLDTIVAGLLDDRS